MKALWSHWSIPYATSPGSWLREKFHLYAWVLSFELARRHLPETEIVTDDAGARLLVDGIGLDFDHVVTSLNALSAVDRDWWALGKLHAYRLQTAPFVHIDSDVFLWKPLPKHLLQAGVFAQNPEGLHDCGYDVAKLVRLNMCGGWVPHDIVTIDNPRMVALCCGIFGGNRIDFINHYAATAVRLIEDPRNRSLWPTLGTQMILAEQFLPLAQIQYHRQTPESPFSDVDVACLFESMADAFNESRAQHRGYTHLLGGAKRNPAWLELLQSRVRRDFPARYDACARFLHDRYHPIKERDRWPSRESIETWSSDPTECADPTAVGEPTGLLTPAIC